MTTTTTVTTDTSSARLAGYAAVLGAITSAVAGAIQVVRVDDGSPEVGLSEHVVLTLVALSLLLWLPAYVRLGRTSSRLGLVGGYLAGAGAAILAAGMTSTNLHGEDYSWFPVVAAPANLAWLAGSVLLAVATWRAGTLPRTLAAGLAVVWLTSIILSQAGGGLVAGAIFAVVGILVARGPRP
ncbi:hypothetical protein [Dactylosporangium sp. NPDC006015]|uniref:hypothetical protein n=1 Tax=Dactylosporangium sp. NPDC006015 TaxID=3154576 RepID=UPI0033A9C94F